MNQEEKKILAQVAALPAAIAYLRENRKPDFPAFDTIMRCHVLEIPALADLQQPYQRKNWHGLSAKMRAATRHITDTLVSAASNSASREELRTLADRIRLLQLLAAVAMEYSQTEYVLD